MGHDLIVRLRWQVEKLEILLVDFGAYITASQFDSHDEGCLDAGHGLEVLVVANLFQLLV